MDNRRANSAQAHTLSQRRTSTDIRSSSLDRNHFCAQDGYSMGRSSARDGVRQWHDLLAQTAGLAGIRCLGENLPYHPAKYALRKETGLDQSVY